MSTDNIRITLVFPTDDQAWVRRSGIAVPQFWAGHSIAPAVGDVLRIGDRQFTIEARVWEHDGTTPLLRLFLGSGHAQTDTSFG
jgi:hypothetical protein